MAGTVLASALNPGFLPAEELTLPDTLTLPELEQLVIERNPSLARSRAEAEEASARASQAGALEDPMLDIMVAPGSFGSESVDPAYRVGLMQPLPLFGQRGLRRRQAEAEAEAARAGVVTTRLDLLLQTREAYFAYYRAVRGLETNAFVSELMHSVRRVALAKYSAGTVGQHEPLQAEVEIAMLDHDRQVIERQRRAATARLNALLHRVTSDPLPPPEMVLESSHLVANTDTLHSWASRQRPELAAARMRVSARRAQLALARRARLPETSFGTAYDRFWMEPELRPTVSVQFNLPFNLGRIRAAEAEAAAGVDKAEAETVRLEDEIGREVQERLAELEESQHELRIIREALIPATDRTLAAARASYEADRMDFQGLLSVTREFARVRLMLHELLAQSRERRAALARAIGAAEIEP